MKKKKTKGNVETVKSRINKEKDVLEKEESKAKARYNKESPGVLTSIPEIFFITASQSLTSRESKTKSIMKNARIFSLREHLPKLSTY